MYYSCSIVLGTGRDLYRLLTTVPIFFHFSEFRGIMSMETFKVKVELVSTVVITVTADNAKEAMNKVDQMDPDQIIDSGYFLSCDVTEVAVL